MKTTLCVIGTVLALAVAAPVSAQDRVTTDNGVWAPWTGDQQGAAPISQVSTISSVPEVSRPAAVTRVAAQAPAPEAEAAAPRLIRLDRFWVVGSFR